MSLLGMGATWFRQTLAWSNTWSSWQERCIMAALVLVGAFFGWLTMRLDFWASAILWALYLIGIAVCTRQGWLKLFGHVLFYDMITTARRTRYVVMRLFYASILLSILCFMYLMNARPANGGRDPTSAIFSIIGLIVLLGGLVTVIMLLMFVESTKIRWGLFAILLVIIGIFVSGPLFFDLDLVRGNDRDNTLMAAQMAQNFFSIFMCVQLALVVLLTPAYVAGAISEEKDRKTMEFMLATDLYNREIVLSKFLSRLANMSMFLITGLPIMSVLQFMGGVDTHLMLAGFAATGLTMLGVGALSILFSTIFQKPRDSIGMTYLVIVAYIAIGTVAFGFSAGRASIKREPIWWSDDAPTFADLAWWFNTGNPLTAIIEVGMAIDLRAPDGGATTLAEALPGIVSHFAWFHLIFTLVCVGLSVFLLRRMALGHLEGSRGQALGTVLQKLRGVSEKSDDSVQAPAPSFWDRFRAPVGEEPMLWKELYIDADSRTNWIAWIVGGLLALLTVGIGLWIVGAHAWDWLFNVGNGWRPLQEEMNIWFRVAGTCVASLMLLMVGVRASNTISTERERDTFDALIATPLSAESILASKLLGSITSLRVVWIWFGIMIAMALLTGGVHMLAVPIVIVAWFCYATFFAMVGLWYSMSAQTSMRATIYTVLTTLFLGGGHWLLWLLCCLPIFALTRFDHPGTFGEYLMKFQAGMTPPFVIAICSYSIQDLQQNFRHDDFVQFIIFSLIGLFLWGMGCLIMWYGVLIPKFKQITRREELIYQ